MAKPIKKTAKKQGSETETVRAKKQFYVVQVAAKDDNNQIVKHTAYPETTTNEKALKAAIAEFQNCIGVQITGVYSSAKDLIKTLQQPK